MARSRGSLALAKLDKHAIANALDVSIATVELWRSGNRRPAEAKQIALEAAPFNVLRAWWNEQPEASAPRPRLDPPTVSTIEAGRAIHLEQVNSMLAVCHQALADAEAPLIDPRERAGIMRAAAPTAQLLAKLLGQVDLTPAQIVRAPAFRQVAERLGQALAPWPDALRAAVEALESEPS